MPRLAVVFAAYLEVPEVRLQDHFKWNDNVYREYGDDLRVYVVSDVDHELPEYAETVVVPVEDMPIVDGKHRFSICKTKNTGNGKAIEDGAEVIVCTDVDMAFAAVPFRRLVNVQPDEAGIPVYRMAESYSARMLGRLDHGCTGTVSMTADNWREIPFDERCVGYGADDGILLRAIEAAGLTVDRSGVVSHIAHVTGDGDRQPGRGADTCWGRESGFNFDNFANNRRWHTRRRKR